MKRSLLVVVICFFTLVTFLQHHLIVSSLVSLLTWCILVISHPNSFSDYWNAALFEYWLAVGVWMAVAVWLVRSIVRTRKRASVPILSSESEPIQRWSVYVLCLVSFVAVTSPFLTPVDPNVQGNLLTTRLLSPLSVGHVREYLDVENLNPETEGSLHDWFVRAKNSLLNRTTSISGDVSFLEMTGFQRRAVVVREFRVLFLFGTDDNARDVFSRIVAGTRISLGIGIGAALGALLIGTAIGFASGLSRGIPSNIYMRLTDLFLAIPSLFLVIGILAFVGQSPITIVTVLSFSGWMGIARIVRGEVIALRDREFILASRLLGVSAWRIIIQHLLPNLRPVIITAAVLQFANAVLAEAALGFLGLGVQPPTATWGNMMGEALGYLSSAWWVGVFPGALLSLVIISAHSMGEKSNFGEASKYSLKQ